MGQAALALPAQHAAASPSVSDDGGALSLAERIGLVKPPCFWPAMPGKPPLSAVERLGLIRLATSIHGEACDETLVAFIEAMRHAPAGDVVEVGSGRGRTAALLVWLARRYQIGQVLCLDRWSDGDLSDFEVDLAPLADGRLNYLQLDGADYRPELGVTTATFGETRYDGRIALLHLARMTDPAPWAEHVAPCGWIVFGEPGPAADAYLAASAARISASFSAGGALFVQLKRNQA
jgi:hypothetical protein